MTIFYMFQILEEKLYVLNEEMGDISKVDVIKILIETIKNEAQAKKIMNRVTASCRQFQEAYGHVI